MTSSTAKGSGRRFSVGPSLPLLPFLAFVTVFLFVPTVTVIIGAFQTAEGGFSAGSLSYLGSAAAVAALKGSLIVSAASAIIGAVVGGLVAYIISTAPPRSLLRRVVVSVSGVLAQFGGVTLAFAFLASYGFSGMVTLALANRGVDLYGDGWLFRLPGITLVYTYFQIPLMVIVFLPALEGLRPQWREAAVNLGATTRQYWLEVGLPLLRPAFLGSTLLLFANSFAAYATVAALVGQGAPVTPLLIRQLFSSEVLLGGAVNAKVLALEMVVVVAVVMALYAWLLRRTSRWLR
ncbi:MAG: hypothetical protein R2731_18895 [Nocardioides sp.]